MAWKKICVAVDGSKESADAILYVGRQILPSLARGHKPTIVLLYVSLPKKSFPFRGINITQKAWDKIYDEHQTKSKEVMSFARQYTSALQFSSIFEAVVEGDPREEIARFCEENDVDLLVMGVRKKHHMGSVSTAVIHASPCPILVVREGDLKTLGRTQSDQLLELSFNNMREF